jgi:hypothetical protein
MTKNLRAANMCASVNCGGYLAKMRQKRAKGVALLWRGPVNEFSCHGSIATPKLDLARRIHHDTPRRRDGDDQRAGGAVQVAKRSSSPYCSNTNRR